MKNNQLSPEEIVSLLMDGELDLLKEHGINIDDLIADDHFFRLWSEYHLVRDGLNTHQDTTPIPLPLADAPQANHPSKKAANDWLFNRRVALAAGVAAAFFVWQLMPSATGINNNALIATHAPKEQSTQSQTVATANPSTNHITTTASLPESMARVHPDVFYLDAHQKAMNTDGLLRVSNSFGGE